MKKQESKGQETSSKGEDHASRPSPTKIAKTSTIDLNLVSKGHHEPAAILPAASSVSPQSPKPSFPPPDPGHKPSSLAHLSEQVDKVSKLAKSCEGAAVRLTMLGVTLQAGYSVIVKGPSIEHVGAALLIGSLFVLHKLFSDRL